MKFFIIILIPINLYSEIIADFGKQADFFFGLATAPAHVEDNLNDSWLDYALQGKVAAFFNHPYPAARLNFWSNPEVEIELAAKTGVKVFRMGVDWGRLVPQKPDQNSGIQDMEAMKQYIRIVDMVRSHGMDVMMTLFHHSVPTWAIKDGGWKNRKLINHFNSFAKDVVEQLRGKVKYWITFNEPSAFAFLTYVAGLWPPGKANYLGLIPKYGVLDKSVDNMAKAHNHIYNYMHSNYSRKEVPFIGFANNVSIHTPIGPLNEPSAKFMSKVMNHGFLEKVLHHIDFHGINYYGEEFVNGLGVYINPQSEYSESGRAIRTEGLYFILKEMHKKYNRKNIPFIITENGISDRTDVLRPSYLIEHLLAVHQAIRENIPVKGYIFWTISDNWEWSDGYCPKFGLLDVDRKNNLNRSPRPSYHIFSKIAATGQISKIDRSKAWMLVENNYGKIRPFCRSLDGKTALNTPSRRPFVRTDWRFNKNRRKIGYF